MGQYIHFVSFQINSPMNHTVLSWAHPDDNRLKALGVTTGADRLTSRGMMMA